MCWMSTYGGSYGKKYILSSIKQEALKQEWSRSECWNIIYNLITKPGLIGKKAGKCFHVLFIQGTTFRAAASGPTAVIERFKRFVNKQSPFEQR